MKLHVFPASPRAFKVQAFASHIGLPYELCFVDLSKGDQSRPQYAALNPNKLMPSLEDDGFVLWESDAILQYLASKKPEAGALPDDARGRADVTRWQFWNATRWDPACAILIFENYVKALFSIGERDPAEVEKGEKRFHAAAAVLDAHLKDRKFVCGDRLTVADFSIGSVLVMAEKGKLPLEPYANIRRWYAALSALPAWRKTLQESGL